MTWQQANAALLAGLVQQAPLGLVSDMDGTLSPIMPSPEQAYVSPRAQATLRTLAQRLPLVALISGRAAADLRERAGLPELVYVGNHGLERWQDEQVVVRPEAAAHRPALQAALDEIRPQLWPGILLEDKGATAAFHYRQTPDRDAARERLQPLVEQVAQQHGLRVTTGHMIFELRPPIEIDKGTAFRELVQTFGLAGAVFIGDDTTDADALREAQAMRQRGECYAVAVGVDAPATPEVVRASSDFLVSGVSGVEDFLDWLANASSASDT